MLENFRVGPAILMYHSIENGSEEGCSVSTGDFREQMSWLSDNGYEFVTLAFLVDAIMSDCTHVLHKKVAVTFDDGYRDFLSNALPILLERDIPATVFVVTDLLGRAATWKKTEATVELMSADELSQLRANGISLGSHTATHANLRLVDAQELRRQLHDSREVVVALGESFLAFSYPWGQSSAQVVDAVKQCGYHCAVSVGGNFTFSRDPYLLPRIAVGKKTDLSTFRSQMRRTPLRARLARMLREWR